MCVCVCFFIFFIFFWGGGCVYCSLHAQDTATCQRENCGGCSACTVWSRQTVPAFDWVRVRARLLWVWVCWIQECTATPSCVVCNVPHVWLHVVEPHLVVSLFFDQRVGRVLFHCTKHKLCIARRYDVPIVQKQVLLCCWCWRRRRACDARAGVRFFRILAGSRVARIANDVLNPVAGKYTTASICIY